MNKSTITAFTLAIISFILTIIISPYHTGGDQVVYTRVYNEILFFEIIDAFFYYREQIVALDIIHFFYIYLCSNIGLSKNISMGFANAILFYLASKTLFVYYPFRLFSFFFVLSNYYLLAFSFTLERYKFSVIFLIGAIYWLAKRDGRAWIAALMAVLGHLSSVIPVLLWLFNGQFTRDKGSYISVIQKYQSRFIFIGLLIVFMIFNDDLIFKIDAYFFASVRSNIFISVFKTSLLMLLAIISADRFSINHIVLFLPLIIFSFLIEPSRINFFAYVFLLYFIFKSRNLFRAQLIYFIVSIYFSTSGIMYLINVIENGG